MIKRNKKAFTLVEIVIVIAIIGILMAVLIPTFAIILNNAKKTSDAQIAKNMTTELYPFIFEGCDYYTASDIRHFVNLEELEPMNKENASFWLNKETREVIVSRGEDLPIEETVSAAGNKTVILEEFIPGFLLLDTKGSVLANEINNIKKLEKQEDFGSIISNLTDAQSKGELKLTNDQFEGLIEHVNKFNPSRTLFVNDFGYFTTAQTEEFEVERMVDGELQDLTISKVIIENVVFSEGILTLPPVDTSGSSETNIFACENLEISFVNDVILPSSLKTISQDNVMYYVDNTIPSRNIDTNLYNLNSNIKTQGMVENPENRLFSIYLLERVLGLKNLNVNARQTALAQCTFNIATDKAKLVTEDTLEKDQYSELSITVNIPRYGQYELLEGGVDEFGKPLTEDLLVDSPEASGRTPVKIYNDEILTQRYRYVKLSNGKIRVEAKIFDEFGVLYSGSQIYTPNIKIDNFTFNKGTLSFSTPLDVPISTDEELFYKLYYSTDNGSTYNEIATLRGEDYISENALVDYVLNEYGNTENNLKNYMLYLVNNEGYSVVDNSGNYYAYNEYLGRFCWHNPNGTENTQITVVPSLENMSNYYILKTGNDELLDGEVITKIQEQSRIEIVEYDDPTTTDVVEKTLKELYYISSTEITQVDEMINGNKCVSVSVKEDHNTTERYIQPYTIPQQYLVQNTDSQTGQTYNTIFAKVELLIRKNGVDKILSSNIEEFGNVNNSIKQSYFEESIFNQDMASYGYDYQFRDPLYYTTDNAVDYTELFTFTDKKILSYEKDTQNENAYYITVEGIGNSLGQGINTYIYDAKDKIIDTQSYNATFYVSYKIIANRINDITITGQDNYYTLNGQKEKYNTFIYKQRTSYTYSPTQKQIPTYTVTLTKFNGKDVMEKDGETNAYTATIYNGEVFNPLTTLFTVKDSNEVENLCNANIFNYTEEVISANEMVYTFYTQNGEIKVYCTVKDINVNIKFVNNDITSSITMSPSNGGSVTLENGNTTLITCGYNDTITFIAPTFEEGSPYAFVCWYEEQDGLSRLRLSGKTTYTYTVPDNNVTIYCEIATSYLFDDTFVFTYTDTTKTCKLTLCNNKDIKDVYVPSYSGDYKVVEISNNAFSGCTQINSITIPNTVETIGNSSFAGSNIENNNESRYFGNYLYKYNDTTNVVENYKVEEGTKIIGNNSFKNNTNIKMIYLPDTVTQINDYAFERATNLEYVFVSKNSNLTKIGTSAFNNCLSLKGIFAVSNIDEIFEDRNNIPSDMTQPESLTTIGNTAFQMCLALEKFDFTNITTLGSSSFNNCVKLENVDLLNTQVVKIPNNCFSNCASLSNVKLGDNIINIGSQAFSACNSLEEIVLPNNVETYGNYILDNCLSLKKVTVPQTMTVLPLGMFRNCSTLNELVNLDFTKLTRIGQEAFSGCKMYPFGNLVVGSTGVDFEIGTSAFLGCEELKSIIFKGNWTTKDLGSINTVFSGCLNLTTADMNGVTNIGNGFFYNCILLESVSNLTLSEIKNQIFFNCYVLTTKVVSDFSNYTKIGYQAFINCYNIPFGNITFGKTTKNNQTGIITNDTAEIVIGYYAFNNCDKLTGVTINAKNVIFDSIIKNGVYTNSYCISACDLLKELIINCDNLTFNGNHTLRDNPILVKVELNTPNLVGGVLKNGTLYGSTLLERVVIPYNTTGMETGVFQSNTNLKNVTKYYDENYVLEKGDYDITSLNANAFKSSPFAGSIIKEGFLVKQTTSGSETVTTVFAYLGTKESITVPYSQTDTTTINSYAFANTTLVNSLTMENNLTTILDYAFKDANIKSLTFNQEQMPEISTSALDGIYEGLTVIVPTNLLNEYKANLIFQDFTINNSMLYTLTIVNNVVTGYTGTPIKIELSEEITGIASNVFKDCLTLEYIDLANVTSVGDNAFSGCTNLKTVLYDNLTSVGVNAFNGCSKLNLEGLPSKVVTIGANAFNGVTSLTTVTIPETVTSIGTNAFTSATTVYCIGTPATIGTNPFPVATKIYVPNALETIYESQWSAYASIIVPNTEVITEDLDVQNGVLVKYICADTTIDLSSRTDIVTIGQEAFKGNTTLKYLTLPNTITTINASAFEGCTKLIDLKFDTANSQSALVTTIGAKAFSGCTSLKNLVGLDFTAVTTIGANAFYNCKVMVYNNLTIKASSIGANAFQNCAKLTNVTLDSTIKTLPNYIFSGCSGLVSVTLPTTVTAINTYAFNGCTKLATIENLDFSKITSIGAYAFNNCKAYNFGEVTLTDKVIYGIGKYAFQNCTNLTKLTITHVDTQTKAITLVEGLFSGATALTEVKLTQLVTKIGTKTFYNCKNLKAVYTDTKLENTLNLESYIVDVAKNAFTNCDSIVTINTSGINLNLGDNVFESMDNLVNINFNATIKKLGSNALKGNTKITQIDIGNITAFGTTVFSGCSGLKEIDLGTATETKANCFGGATYIETIKASNLTKISANAFQNCRNLKNLIIDWTKITSIGNYAFDNCINLEFVAYQDNNGTLTATNSTELVLGNAESTLTLGTHVFRNAFQPQAEGQTSQHITTIRVASELANSKIPNNTFYAVKSIKTIIFDKPVTQIGDYAFSNCIDLEVIKGDGFVTENFTYIGAEAFAYCRKLNINDTNEIVIGNNSSTLTVGATAFRDMLQLEKVEFKATLSVINNYTFYNCVSLKEVIFKAGTDDTTTITAVNNYAFSGCYSLQSIKYRKVDNSLMDFDLENATIKTYAFQNCKNLDWGETLVVGSLTSTYNFQNNYKLTNVVVKSGTLIPDYTFNGCLNLETVVLPSTINTIGTAVFYNCIRLTSVLDGDDTTKGFDFSKLTVLKNQAFYNCVNLKHGVNLDGKITLGTLTTLGTSVFESNYNLNEVTISGALPSGKLLDSTFRNCIRLTKVVIAEDITSIGKTVFENCYSLTSLTDEEGNKLTLSKVTLLDNSAFKECQSLETEFVLSALTKMGTYVFYNNKELKSVDFTGSTITAIGDNNFYGCERLESVTFASKMVTLGNNVFVDCFKLTLSSDALKQFKAMGTSCFKNCQSLTKVIIGKNLTTLSANIFENCVNLTSFDYEDGAKMTTIGNYAFNGCVKLTSVVLPASLKTIGNYSFSSCTLLTLIEVDRNSSNNVLSVSNSVFNSATKTFFVFETNAYATAYQKIVKTMASRIISKENFNQTALEKGIWLLESTYGEQEVYVLIKYSDLYTKVIVDITNNVITVMDGEEIVLELSGKPLNSIYYYAFANCTKLEELIFNGNLNNVILYKNYDFKSSFSVVNNK